MRHMTSPFRRPPGDAVDEAWTARDVRRIGLATLALSAVVGAFLGFVGAFGLSDYPVYLRIAYLTPLAVACGLVGFMSYWLAGLLSPAAGRWIRAALGSLLCFLPIGVIVWLTTGLLPGVSLNPAELPRYVGTSLVVSFAMTFLAVALTPPSEAELRKPGAGDPPERFLTRLPVRLRTAEIWAVEAEDHYLRVHTSAGQDLILLRMADAVAELGGQEGMQVHRSWWVARVGIADARRADGRATLTLKNGVEAPVSRTYAAELRRRGWI